MAKMPISFKKAANKTSIKHNNRDFNEKDWKNDFHKHIDRERTPNNVVIKQEPIRDAYDRIFGEALEKYNDKQRRKDRKIDDYYDHVKQSKTLNTQYEFIIQVGKKDDFEDSPVNWETANQILIEYVDDFQERNPNFEIYNAVIHNDEGSPHLHLNVIPVAEGYKRGLERQPAFNKALENQGITFDTDSRTIFRNFREQEIDGIEQSLNRKGIERLKVGTNQIESHHEYKEMVQEVEKMAVQVESSRIDRDVLEKDKNALAAKIEPLKTEFQGLSEQRDEIDDEIQKKHQQMSALLSKSAKIDVNKLGITYETRNVEVPTGEHDLFGRKKTTTKKERTGNLILPEKSFKTMRTALNQSLSVKVQLDEYSKTDFIQENKQLKKEYTDLSQTHNGNVDDYNDLLEENQSLKTEVKSLREEINQIYEGLKEFFRERTDTLQQAKSLLGGVVEKVRDRMQGSLFERTHKKEIRRENDRGGRSR